MVMAEPVNGPRVGQYLYSSCRGESIGRIINVKKDDDGNSIIDFVLFQCAYDMLTYSEVDIKSYAKNKGKISDIIIEIPSSAKVILRNIVYVDVNNGFIECRTPGMGCYRCDKLFRLTQDRIE